MSSVDISQEQAQWLFTEGAILVFLDLPAGSEFGMDYCCWEVGEQFKGVKMIPPGIHFVYYRFVFKCINMTHIYEIYNIAVTCSLCNVIFVFADWLTNSCCASHYIVGQYWQDCLEANASIQFT